jgi:hypothetical protein
MLRTTLFVFLLGWVAWFLIDKPPPEQMRLPEVSDSLVENFQVAFDMLKAGYPKVAYVYIWDAHYLLLSLLGGALGAVTYGVISDYLSRRRMRRNFMPPARKAPEVHEKKSSPEQQDTAD